MTKRAVELTDRHVRALKPVPGAQYDRFDKLVRGLYVRVSYDGTKSWGLKYVNAERKQRRYKLGIYGTTQGMLGVAAARAEALGLKARIAEGYDPTESRKHRRELVRTSLRFGELVELYIEQHAKPKKRSWREDARILQGPLYFANWHDRLANAITDADVDRRIREIARDHGPIMANRCLAALRKAIAFAIRHPQLKGRAGRPDHNPCRDVEKPAPELSRDRIYSDAEIVRLWASFGEIGRAGDVFKFMVLTGCRLKEAARMRWEELDGATWTIPSSRSKNKRPNTLTLPALALEIIERLRQLRSDYVFVSPVDASIPFNGFGKAARKARKLSSIADFHTHDLRRTCGSGITRLGFPRAVMDAVLGHVVPGVGGVYDRYGYAKEKAEALAAWERHLCSVLRLGGNVVSIATGQRA